MALLIGLGNRKFVGKSVCGRILREKHGFTEINFADALKEDLLDRFPETLDALATLYVSHPQFSWEMVEAYTKRDMERIRKYLVYELKPPAEVALIQNYGTEVRRRDDPGYWVARWQERVWNSQADRIVCCDVRFMDEAEAVHAFGGKLYQVVRPNMEKFNDHRSEAELDAWAGWDGTIYNSGTEEELDDLLNILLQKLS